MRPSEHPALRARSEKEEKVNRASSFALKFIFAALILLLTVQLCFSQNTPRVLKVDPPSWWADHSINPVRLLIRGANLGDARVAAAEGLRVGAAKVNAAGTYLFADVHIDPQTNPGLHYLHLTTPA